MAVFGQGAAGTRIRLRDESEVSLVTDPTIVGGAIGYSTRGEFNKIIELRSSSNMDVFLGGGFNNPKYNQSLYASRAVLDNGGFAEFVRLYGEPVELDDTKADYELNQKLKTDTFLVEYDFSTSADVSFDINYFAATRHMQDGLTNVGEREIYTIQEVVTKNATVNFIIDSNETATDRLPIFAIMNTDPTSAFRAGQRFDIDSIIGVTTSPASAQEITVKTINVNNLQVGDTIAIAGTVNFNESAVTVFSVLGSKSFTYKPSNPLVLGNEGEGAVYLNEDTVDNGVDSLILKTVASGKSSKKFEYLTLNAVGTGTSYDLPGKFVNVNMPDGSDMDFEFVETVVTAGKTPVPIVFSAFDDSDVNVTANSILISNVEDFPVGSIVQIYKPSGNTLDGVTPFTDYIVAEVAGNVITLALPSGQELDITGTPSGTGFKVISITETLENLKAVMINTDDTGTLGAVPTRGIFNGVTDVDVSANKITVDDASKFSVGDLVMMSDIYSRRGQEVFLPSKDGSGNEIVSGSFFLVTSLERLNDGRGILTFDNYDIGTGLATTPLSLFDTSEVTNDYVQTIVDAATGTEQIKVSDAYKFQVGDKVLYTQGTGTIGGLTDGETYIVSAIVDADEILLSGVDITGISSSDSTLTNVSANDDSNFRITNLTKSKGGSIATDTGKYGKQFNLFGVFGLRYPESVQTDSFFDDSGASPRMTKSTDLVAIDETDDGIIIDSTAGRIFENLGLATKEYLDVDFDFHNEAHYKLTPEGELVAQIYLFVEYIFNGQSYKFDGTIVPFAVSDTNLYIVDAANSVANGWKFVINENAALEAAIGDPRFNFSNSENMGLIEDDFSNVSFNSSDPAILNDAVWSYDPKNNSTSAILTSGWELFLDKDKSRADMLVSAGTAVSNLFVRGLEQINFNVMNKMLDICEKRKDMFAIFDGLDEPRVDIALEKMSGAGSQGDMARWGGIFDGRSIFFDSVYTKLSIDVVKSIELAAIITSNRAGGLWWLPPAGYQTGRVPGFVTRQKILRSYNYADDPNSDIARLYDENINPTRVNDQGMVIYGQKTMLKRSTALNRMNVVMLIAGIHKRFANFLDNKVFQLNTPTLRSNIQSELQANIESIKSATPAGLTDGNVICNETNNPPRIIDTNQLIVDVVLQPTRAAEFITLRTTVKRTGESLNVTETTII